MPILNYTTEVKAENTIAQIYKILVSHGASKIVTDYKNGLPHAVTFSLTIGTEQRGFCLPANFTGVLNAMKKDANVPNRYCNAEQAQMVAWRIVKDWVEAQMAIVDAQVCEMSEVFLPYMITKSGDTLFGMLKSGGLKQLTS